MNLIVILIKLNLNGLFVTQLITRGFLQKNAQNVTMIKHLYLSDILDNLSS